MIFEGRWLACPQQLLALAPVTFGQVSRLCLFAQATGLRGLAALRMLAWFRLCGATLLLGSAESLKNVVPHLVLETTPLRNELVEQVVMRNARLAKVTLLHALESRLRL